MCKLDRGVVDRLHLISMFFDRMKYTMNPVFFQHSKFNEKIPFSARCFLFHYWTVSFGIDRHTFFWAPVPLWFLGVSVVLVYNFFGPPCQGRRGAARSSRRSHSHVSPSPRTPRRSPQGADPSAPNAHNRFRKIPKLVRFF